MRGAALLATVVAPLIAAVQPAEATNKGHEAKPCGLLAKGAADYRIKARKVTCRFARRWSRAYLNRRGAPTAFDCYRPNTTITFYCADGAKAYWGERLTATAAHPGHGPVPVDVGGAAFKQADIRVGTGDTVLWIWTGPDLDHTVTADPGQAEQFDSDPGGPPSNASHPVGSSFSHVFNREGQFTYYCKNHPSMQGVVEVVRISAPAGRPRLSALRVANGKRGTTARFRLSARADVVGRISRRQGNRWVRAKTFYRRARTGKNRVKLPVRGLQSGRYQLSLVAYDAFDRQSNRIKERFSL
jgi:plastocyanin